MFVSMIQSNKFVSLLTENSIKLYWIKCIIINLFYMLHDTYSIRKLQLHGYVHKSKFAT